MASQVTTPTSVKHPRDHRLGGASANVRCVVRRVEDEGVLDGVLDQVASGSQGRTARVVARVELAGHRHQCVLDEVRAGVYPSVRSVRGSAVRSGR